MSVDIGVAVWSAVVRKLVTVTVVAFVPVSRGRLVAPVKSINEQIQPAVAVGKVIVHVLPVGLTGANVPANDPLGVTVADPVPQELAAIVGAVAVDARWPDAIPLILETARMADPVLMPATTVPLLLARTLS